MRHPQAKGQYAAPVTTGSDDNPSTPKGYRDAPPASKGRYAAPATTGCDDDPLMPKGHRDAPPAIQGWYATAATTACDDDPAAKCEKKLKISNQQNLAQLAIKQKETYRHESFNGMSSSREAEPSNAILTNLTSPDCPTRLAEIRSIAKDIQQQSGKDNDVLEALHLTFDKDDLKAAIPRRIVECSPDMQYERRQFVFHPDYANHLLSVMRMSGEVLNDFLQVAGSR
jgi:hypothetical protein